MFDDQTLKNAELDKKNEKQDTAINANKNAIQANSTAIQANADAIKANKAEADATQQMNILTAVSKTIPITSIKTKLLSKTK